MVILDNMRVFLKHQKYHYPVYLVVSLLRGTDFLRERR
jgi:hypothetical protein